MKIKAYTLALAIAFAVIAPGAAQAIPAFSKKYESSCTVCHTTWPKLNQYGTLFKLNGYKLIDSKDEGHVATISPSKNLFLNLGKGEPPISILLTGGATVLQPKTGPDGEQSDKYICCYEGNAVKALMGGTVGPDIAYWLSLPWGNENVEQGYIRFTNFFGPSYLNLDFGAMKVIDYDAVSEGREWFASPLVSLRGYSTNPRSRSIGMGAPSNDTGIRIYGRPGFGKFTYEGSIYTGNQIVGAANDDDGYAFTMMGRLDIDRLAFSFRYWMNLGGSVDLQGVTPDGNTIVFVADPAVNSEETNEFIISARYTHPVFEVDFVYDSATFTAGDRSMTDGEGVKHKFSQGNVKRQGLSLRAVWLVNSWFETGIGYGLSSIAAYNVTVDGNSIETNAIDASLIEIKADIRPTMNMRVGLEIQIDASSSGSRMLSDGSSYDAQSRALLQWKLTF